MSYRIFKSSILWSNIGDIAAQTGIINVSYYKYALLWPDMRSSLIDFIVH